MKKLLCLLALASTFAFGQVIDRPITSKGPDGKVIIAPQNSSGVPTSVMEMDSTNGISVSSKFRATSGVISEEYVGVDPEVGGSSPFQLVNGNKRKQMIAPTGAITVKLPSTGIKSGEVWEIHNRGGNTVTIQSQDGDSFDIIAAGYLIVTAIQDTPTDATHWFKNDVYENVSFSGTPTGARTSGSVNCKAIRMNRAVTMRCYLAYANADATVNSIYLTVANGFSSRLAMPSANHYAAQYAEVANSGLAQLGSMKINNDGLRIQAISPSTFTSGSIAGLGDHGNGVWPQISYIIE